MLCPFVERNRGAGNPTRSQSRLWFEYQSYWLDPDSDAQRFVVNEALNDWVGLRARLRRDADDGRLVREGEVDAHGCADAEAVGLKVTRSIDH